MKYAVIFPGQGAQRPGMGQAFCEKYKVSADVFAEADEALGFKLSDIVFNGTPEELAKTAITQPAILTTSIAVYRAAQDKFGGTLYPVCMAGHSLGEYTALVASGVLSLADGVRLVHLRGQLMQEAVPLGVGNMLAVVGMKLDEVMAVCKQAEDGQVCSAANVNQPEQIVISGNTEAVARAEALIKERQGARVIPLRVSAPFHCSLMRPVAEKLKEEFEKLTWHTPCCPIVSNAEATLLSNTDEIRRALYEQTYSPVLWVQDVLKMQEFGVEHYIEMGPGSVLSGLVRKILKGNRPFAVSLPEELDVAFEVVSAEGGQALFDSLPLKK